MNEPQPTVTEGALGRKAIFSIVCGGHFINHFQSAMLGVIYPLMMRELGIGFLAIASIAAVYNTVGNIFQALYGFIVPRVGRGVILGVGNCVLGLSVTATGSVSSVLRRGGHIAADPYAGAAERSGGGRISSMPLSVSTISSASSRFPSGL